MKVIKRGRFISIRLLGIIPHKQLRQMNTDIKNAIDQFIKGNSKGNIEELSKYLNRLKKDKYPDHKVKKLGDLTKEVKDSNLKKILDFEKKDKIKLAYLYMFNMGLRVSEVVRIKKENILDNKLIIDNIKCKRRDVRVIPKHLMELTKEYMERHKHLIKQNSGYLIYSENRNSKNNNISENWLRNHFRETTLKLNINKVYDISSDGRNLYLISSHSGRHSFCMKFYRKAHFDIEKTKIAMRLRSLETLQSYLKTDINEVDKIMMNLY